MSTRRIEWGMPFAQNRHNICHSAEEDGMETFQWRGTGDILPSVC